MDDATHVLDVVAVKGRAHVTVWRTDPRLHGVDLKKLLIRSCEDARKERDGSGAMCRAFHKIEEATSRAGVVVDPAWRCVDVGAAPGGWTQWLCDNDLDEKKGGRVYAVDPAELEGLGSVADAVSHLQAGRSAGKVAVRLAAPPPVGQQAKL